MWLRTLALLLSFLVGFSACTSPDDSLLPYLKGMNWNKVQQYLKEDLRLSDSVVPTNYAIELSVNAEILELALFSEPTAVLRISSNPDRETITIHLNRTIKPKEQFMLQILYNGMAKMDEYGLYENWDPKLNKSLDSNGPFVLASKNFPTGARFWFPCFDEPDKKATFEFQINHPRELSVYSNSEIARTEGKGGSRTLTVFKKTRSLATYQTALAINHYSSQTLDVEGFEEAHLIMSKNSHAVRTSFPDPMEVQKRDKDIPVISTLLKKNLELLHLSGVPKEDKLDIIILEGAYTLSIQPGLITVGRYNFWRFLNKQLLSQDLKNLAQVRIGNHVSVRSLDQVWLNNIFTNSLPNDTYADFQQIRFYEMDADTLYASLHEKSLRDLTSFRTSTKQYLTSKNEIPSLKASHLLRLFIRYCRSSPEEITQAYVNETIGSIPDVDHFIDILSRNCGDALIAKEFLNDFIDQPGKAFLSVKRTNDSVLIRQTRYHSTYFDSKLRDNRTRYTIPIFFTIDGEEDVKVFRKNETTLEIPVPKNSLFLINHEYDHLYFAYYEDSIVPQRNMTSDERDLVKDALVKSMVAAISIGFVRYQEVKDRQDEYINKGIFNKWELQHMHCLSQWNHSATYRSFIEENFLGDNTVIQPEHIAHLAQRDTGRDQWQDLHRLFFRNAANYTDHRFNLLAHAVLNQVRVENFLPDSYPSMGMRDDYLRELREFVIHNPRRAASMSAEIETRLEREYVKEWLPKFHDYKERP